jgi:hypothetical protein
MPSGFSGRFYFLIVSVVVLMAGLIWWLTDQSTQQANSRPNVVRRETVWKALKKKAQGEAPVEVGRSDQLHTFRLLLSPSERIPRSTETQIQKTIGARPGEFHFELTQRARRNPPLWVVSGEGVTCIAANGGDQIACNTAIRVAKRGLLLGVGSTPRHAGEKPSFLVGGFTPNWAKAARVKVGGRVRDIRIKNNAYLVQSHQRITVESLKR